MLSGIKNTELAEWKLTKQTYPVLVPAESVYDASFHASWKEDPVIAVLPECPKDL